MMLMKIVAWTLLLAGVFLAVAGAAQNGAQHASHRVHLGYVGVITGAQTGVSVSEARRSLAVQGYLNKRSADDPSYVEVLGMQEVGLVSDDAKEALGVVVSANSRLVAARAIAENQRLLSGVPSLGEALKSSNQVLASNPLPTPVERLTDWLQVGGVWWGVGCVMVAVGAFIARREQALSNAGKGSSQGAGENVNFPDTVDFVLRELQAIREQIADLPMDGQSTEVRSRIDDIMEQQVGPLVQVRGRFIARHGLSRFAIYFGEFSGGERNLNRTWSALTDGHSVVARASLETSIAAFTRARNAWEEIDQAS
ncbi:MAG: hypothetical protein ACI9MC_000286 [Kiritimatiellia bacterium]|jgi:hypothetical protein